MQTARRIKVTKWMNPGSLRIMGLNLKDDKRSKNSDYWLKLNKTDLVQNKMKSAVDSTQNSGMAANCMGTCLGSGSVILQYVGVAHMIHNNPMFYSK